MLRNTKKEEDRKRFRDICLIRFNQRLKDEDDDGEGKPLVRVVRDAEFISDFRRRANDKYWESIDCV